MTDRIVDISSTAARLKARNELLVIEVDGAEPETIPFSELACVVVSHGQVVFTQAVLTNLATAGAAFITCDPKHHPAAMLLPLVGHYVQVDRFTRQAGLTVVRKKRLWQAIVRAKITAQARLLTRLRGADYGLKAMIPRVGSGDLSNVEARAARRYWLVVFDDSTFRRGNEEDPRNALLNYGYAILRAAAVRALCSSGLHPSFGLHHSNKGNPFVLGDDLMEPFRPAVDRAVIELVGQGYEKLTPTAKHFLIETVTGRYLVECERRTLFDVLSRTAQSLAAAIVTGDPAKWAPPLWDFVQ